VHINLATSAKIVLNSSPTVVSIEKFIIYAQYRCGGVVSFTLRSFYLEA